MECKPFVDNDNTLLAVKARLEANTFTTGDIEALNEVADLIKKYNAVKGLKGLGDGAVLLVALVNLSLRNGACKEGEVTTLVSNTSNRVMGVSCTMNIRTWYLNLSESERKAFATFSSNLTQLVGRLNQRTLIDIYLHQDGQVSLGSLAKQSLVCKDRSIMPDILSAMIISSASSPRRLSFGEDIRLIHLLNSYGDKGLVPKGTKELAKQIIDVIMGVDLLNIVDTFGDTGNLYCALTKCTLADEMDSTDIILNWELNGMLNRVESLRDMKLKTITYTYCHEDSELFRLARRLLNCRIPNKPQLKYYDLLETKYSLVLVSDVDEISLDIARLYLAHLKHLRKRGDINE